MGATAMVLVLVLMAMLVLVLVPMAMLVLVLVHMAMLLLLSLLLNLLSQRLRFPSMCTRLSMRRLSWLLFVIMDSDLLCLVLKNFLGKYRDLIFREGRS